jgi:hypothetical protein
MSLEAHRIARELFLRAAAAGPAEPPEAVRRTFEELPTHAVQTFQVDLSAIENEVMEEFSTGDTLYSTIPLEPAHAERWISALRWVLQELRAWRPNMAHPWPRLQALLAALSAFDTENAGVDTVLQQLQGTPLPEGLCRLMERAAAYRVQATARGDTPQEKIQATAQGGDFEQLGHLTRHLQLRLRGGDRLAIYLLWRLRADLLASVIKRNQDAVLAYAVREVLGEKAPDFALSVDDVTFKFFSAQSAADMRHANALSESMEVFRELLLQVSNTPAWGSWLQAFYKYPQGGSVSEGALAGALARLQATHWADFVAAVQLWMHAGTVVPVANILIGFYQQVGDPGAREMWSLAFQRWDQWNYGREEPNTYMFAPSGCSFDFPVVMHYANLPPPEATTEEQRLAGAIESIEHEWFSSESELITHRNRLLSRLRLVRHGQALASGATAEPLPPSVQPDGEYSALRYRYFDVNSARSTHGQ